MKKAQIVRLMARESGVTPAEAADQFDRALHHVLTELRRGKKARLPGVGRLAYTRDGRLILRADHAGEGNSAPPPPS